jgi:hypothetical protein
MGGQDLEEGLRVPSAVRIRRSRRRRYWEPVATLLRKGNAGSNTTSDHITVLDQALAQLPDHVTAVDEDGKRATLVRTDAAGATQGFTARIHELGMQFSVGAYLHQFDITAALPRIPKKAWTPACNTDGKPRDGAWVVEISGMADLSAWPPGTRLILRKERPHPGAQLRFTDTDGLRVTGFLTNTQGGQLADLEVRHRRHARVEDRIRAAKDTGLRNLPFQNATQNQIWLEICALATDLIAFTQRLTCTGWAAVAEPKRRRNTLKIPKTWPWADIITGAHHRLFALSTV